MKRTTSGKKYVKVISFVAVFLLFCVTAWASGGGHGAEGAGGGGWQAIDTYKVLNFGLLAIVLFFLARKPVKNFFVSRKQGIEEDLTTLEQKKEAARKQVAEYEARLEKLNEESEKILADYERQGEEAKKRILAEAREQADKLEEMAKRNIEQEFETAKARLKEEIVEEAVEKAEALIRGAISTADQEKLVDEYLEKVVA